MPHYDFFFKRSILRSSSFSNKLKTHQNPQFHHLRRKIDSTNFVLQEEKLWIRSQYYPDIRDMFQELNNQVTTHFTSSKTNKKPAAGIAETEDVI